MTKKDWQRHLAYEALVILGVLALLLFVCRLWPILLLAMLGIIIATLRLLSLSSTQVRPLEPMPPGVHKPPSQNTRGNTGFPDLWKLASPDYPAGAGGVSQRPVGVEDAPGQREAPAGGRGHHPA